LSYKALLAYPGVPNRGPIHHHGYDEGVVYLPPVEELETSDRVAEDIDATYRRLCPHLHFGHVVRPVEVVSDLNTQIAERFDGFDGLDAHVWVSEGEVGGGSAEAVLVGSHRLENHEFGFICIDGETVSVQPLYTIMLRLKSGMKKTAGYRKKHSVPYLSAS
jgi:hypothetical protein